MVEAFQSPTHKAQVCSYDKEAVQGDTIEIRAENADTGDVGNRTSPNTGTFVLFFPLDFTGTDNVTVTGSDGGEDTGTISVS